VAPVSEPAVTADRLLTADDLARRWQVQRSQIYRLERSGKLPSVRLGRYRRFLLEKVEEFERAGGCSNE
jgi:excisionase family DNA binding protein